MLPICMSLDKYNDKKSQKVRLERSILLFERDSRTCHKSQSLAYFFDGILRG